MSAATVLSGDRVSAWLAGHRGEVRRTLYLAATLPIVIPLVTLVGVGMIGDAWLAAGVASATWAAAAFFMVRLIERRRATWKEEFRRIADQTGGLESSLAATRAWLRAAPENAHAGTWALLEIRDLFPAAPVPPAVAIEIGSLYIFPKSCPSCLRADDLMDTEFVMGTSASSTTVRLTSCRGCFAVEIAFRRWKRIWIAMLLSLCVGILVIGAVFDGRLYAIPFAIAAIAAAAAFVLRVCRLGSFRIGAVEGADRPTDPELWAFLGIAPIYMQPTGNGARVWVRNPAWAEALRKEN